MPFTYTVQFTLLAEVEFVARRLCEYGCELVLAPTYNNEQKSHLTPPHESQHLTIEPPFRFVLLLEVRSYSNHVKQQSTFRRCLDLIAPLCCVANCWFSGRHLDLNSGVFCIVMFGVHSLAYIVPFVVEVRLLEFPIYPALKWKSCLNTREYSFLPQPFETLAPFFKQINDFLEKLITWPREVGKAILTCQTTFPAPAM